MGLSLQVPYVQEIVSNEASAKVRDIEIKGQKFLLRKPSPVITEENYKVLQFMNFLVDFDKYMDGSVEDIPARLVQIIKDENITKKVHTSACILQGYIRICMRQE